MKSFYLHSLLRNPAGDGTDGGGGAAAGAGDPGAITKDEIKRLVHEAINGFASRFKGEVTKDITSAIDPIKQLLEGLAGSKGDPPAKGAGTGDPAQGGDGTAGKGSAEAELRAQVLDLQRTLKTVQKKQQETEEESQRVKQEAERADRESQLRSTLANYGRLAGPTATQAAFLMVLPAIKRLDDGSLVANDLPLDAYVKDFLAKPENAFMLAAEEKSGVGASSGRPRSTPSVELSQIKPGMSREDFQRAAAEIKRQLNG